MGFDVPSDVIEALAARGADRIDTTGTFPLAERAGTDPEGGRGDASGHIRHGYVVTDEY